MHLSLAQRVPLAKHELGLSFALSELSSHFGSAGRRDAVLQSSPADLRVGNASLSLALRRQGSFGWA